MLAYYFLTLSAIFGIGISSFIEKLPVEKKFNTILLYFLYILTTLISGFRFQTGGDWQTYEFWYESFEFDSIFTSGVEPGWVLYTLVVKYLGVNFNGYLLITAIISNILIFYSLKKLVNNRILAIIGICFYCFISFYSIQMFYIRSGMAAGLFMLSIWLWETNKLKALATILLSLSIHQAIIIALTLYAVTRIFLFNRLFLLLAYIFLYILFFYIINQYAPDAYVSGNFSEIRELGLKQVIGGILLLTIIYKMDFLKRKYSKPVISISILCFVIPYLFDSYEVGSRVRLFYSSFDGVALALVLSSLMEKKYISFGLLLFALGFIYIFWSNPYTQSIYIPYKTWFFD